VQVQRDAARALEAKLLHVVKPNSSPFHSPPHLLFTVPFPEWRHHDHLFWHFPPNLTARHFLIRSTDVFFESVKNPHFVHSPAFHSRTSSGDSAETSRRLRGDSGSKVRKTPCYSKFSRVGTAWAQRGHIVTKMLGSIIKITFFVILDILST
jgi:hypothetical protein